MRTNQQQGATLSPLEGEPSRRFCLDPAGTNKPPSKVPEPGAEERGRSWCQSEVKKRALKVLERWPPDSKTGTKSPKRGRPLKRLQEPAQGKEDREGKDSALMKWLRRERTGPESNNTCLGPRKS